MKFGACKPVVHFIMIRIMMKWTTFVAVSLMLSLLGAAQITTEPDLIHLEGDGVELTILRLVDKRLTYTERDSNSWIFFTVKNTDRPGRKYFSTISQEGSILIMEQREALEDLALKEKKRHGQNYTSTRIEDFANGGKLLVYEKKIDRSLVERRVFLWWKEGESIIRLDFTYYDFVARKKGKAGRQFVIKTLKDLLINGQPVPSMEAYLEILGD